MAGLLKLPAIGHPQSVNPHGIQNLVAAGLGMEAHISNPPHAAQEIIDRGQQVESDVQKTGSQVYQTAVAEIPHSTSALGHTWTVTEKKVADLGHVPIPWLEGSMYSGL